MKKKGIFLIVILVLILGAYAGYKYVYQDHRNIETEVAVIKLSTGQLQDQFLGNTEESVLNKTIIVTGTITEIDDNAIALDDKVHCSFASLPEGLSVAETVSVKGRCIGYDDLFELVKLDQSTITDR